MLSYHLKNLNKVALFTPLEVIKLNFDHKMIFLNFI
jgi:hypothetical protein